MLTLYKINYSNCHRLNFCMDNTPNNFSIIETKSFSQQFYCCLKIFLRKTSPYTTMPMFNLLKPTGYVMHQQFNIQQLYALPTLYLCVLYLSVFITEMKSVYSAVRLGI